MSGNQNTQVATTPQQRQQSLVESIKHPKMQEQIQRSLPPGVALDRFTAVTLAAFNHNPDLATSDRQSLYNAVIKAAQEGLLPDGQDAVLNVYNTNVAPRGQAAKWVKKVQFQRMKMGVLKQFKKAGIDAYSCCVYENEKVELWNDETGEHIRHARLPFAKDKGEMIGSYAVAPLPNGKCKVATMDMEAIMKAKASSKSGDGDNAPWNKWFDQMAEKSALHRLRRRVGLIDEEAEKELKKIDEEFEEEDRSEQPPEARAQPVPTGTETRPKSLQSVIDQSEEPPTDHEMVDPATGEVIDAGDPGPQEGDVI